MSTYLSTCEDALGSLGFYTMMEFNCFKMLTSAGSVDARVGVSILPELLPEQAAPAVASGNSKVLSRASGVGLKLAQRIALELRDKAKKVGVATVLAGDTAANPVIDNVADVVSALAMLGWSSTETVQVVSRLDSSLSVEELIRLSLRSMGGG